MVRDERIQKRPMTKAKRQALTDARVLEALEREASLGVEHPDHIKKLKAKIKEAKA